MTSISSIRFVPMPLSMAMLRYGVFIGSIPMRYVTTASTCTGFSLAAMMFRR